MSFISLNFVVLFACTFILYHTLPSRFRKATLLTASCLFIGFYHLTFLITALILTLTTFYLGKWIGQTKRESSMKGIYFSGVCFLVVSWLAFRYADRLTDCHILFPLGISFYTFQAISYLTEIYWQEEEPEKSLPDFMIYMLFFMKFLSGPIERASDMLPQLKSCKATDYTSMVYGMRLIVVGLIKKLILADSIAPYIDGVFGSVYTASGVQLLMACLLYPIELYADFSGYTDIALGGARMLGFKLSPNFNRPFIAQTTADFWRRWHMSLSFWVRDYLYLPLSSSLRGWGQWGVFLSLALTFTGLGIWHGAGWNFAVYGLIQGVIIFYEMKTTTFHRRLKAQLGSRLYATLSVVRTYLLFAVSLIFFRASSMAEAFHYISHLSFGVHYSWKEMNIGMPDHNSIVAGSALVLILVYEYFMSKHDLLEALGRQPAAVRWSIYYLLAIITFHTGTVQLGQLHIFTILTIKTHDEEKQRTERSHTFHEKALYPFYPFYSPTGSLFPGRPFHGPEEL